MSVSSIPLPGELPFAATDAVRNALAGMGRTEDLRFSPDGRHLAFACYASDRIAVADIEIDVTATGRTIALTGLVYLESQRLREPHGIDFVDDETIVVGNRGGDVDVFRFRTDPTELELVACAGDASGLLDSPGSVVVRALAEGRHEVLACNNWRNTVTRHPLIPDGGTATGEVAAREWLDLPDGLALSSDGGWLAVSSHNTHAVFIYALGDADRDPVGMLRGVRYPHGLRFANDDRHLLVADAGSPYLHSFASSGDWRGVRLPVATVRVVDDETFASGRKNPAEGGPKGLDVEPRTNVLAVTLEEQALAFFDLDSVLDARPEDFYDVQMAYESLIRSEAEERIARAEEAAARASALLEETLATKAWRMTAPARRVHAVVKQRARRDSA
jgi:hypothetical protein